MASIHFHSPRALTKNELLDALKGPVPVAQVHFSQDEEGGSWATPRDAGALRKPRAGQFNYDYDLYWQTKTVFTLRDEVTLLQQIARHLSVDLLTSDEGPDPYVFIHIEPDGTTSTIGVVPPAYDNENELIIEGVYNTSLGGFALTEQLSEEDDKTIVALLAGYSASPVISGIPFDLVNPDFKAGQQRDDRLKPFLYHYFVKPQGKTTWYSRQEKSGILTQALTTFHVKTGKDVCLFTADSVSVRNIPGGSDSEATCVLLCGGGTEQLIYKQRRSSW